MSYIVDIARILDLLHAFMFMWHLSLLNLNLFLCEHCDKISDFFVTFDRDHVVGNRIKINLDLLLFIFLSLFETGSLFIISLIGISLCYTFWRSTTSYDLYNVFWKLFYIYHWKVLLGICWCCRWWLLSAFYQTTTYHGAVAFSDTVAWLCIFGVYFR